LGPPAFVPQSRDFGVAGVAIDRFTGQVLDKQIEVVNERCRLRGGPT